MEKRLKQMVCLVISALLIINSMPLGVLAEEVTSSTPTQTENPENPMTAGGQTAAADVPASTDGTQATVTETALVPQTPTTNLSTEPSEIIATAETIQTMATAGDYDYDDSVAGIATITKYNGADTAVTIPTILGGRKVVAIGAGAFNGNTNVQKIIVPITVTTINSGSTTSTYTFGGCTKLTDVVIPESVKTIDANAFSNTSGVKISCYKDSRAYQYAGEHNMAYNLLSFSVKLTPSLPSGQNIGSSLTLTAATTGGTGTLTYNFYYTLEKLDGTSATDTIQDTSASTAVLSLTEAGTYTFYVEATNEKDGVTTTCTNVIDSYKVVDQPVVSFTPDIPSPQYADSPIKMTAAVTGGTAPYTYEFSYQIGTSKIVGMTKTDVAASMSWTTPAFTEIGTYTFTVKVTDKYGSETTKTIADYKICNKLSLDGFTVDKASPQELGTALKLTAAASGGKTECEYKFSYTLDGTTEVIQDFSDQSSITFTPPKTGTYTFTAEVTNAYGKVESKTVSGYVIQDTPVIGSFTAAKTDGSAYYVGDADGVILKADGIAEGKEPYCYKYFYKVGAGNKTEFTDADPSKNSYEFSTSTPGTYTFYVEVTDANNLTATCQVSNYVVYATLGGTLTTDKASPQNRETTVKLTANGTGGKGTYKYQFFYKLASEADDQYKPMTATPTTTKTISKLFSDPETYNLKVDITDATGRTTSVATTPEDYLINNNSLINEFKVSDDAFYAGTAMNLTATVDPVSAAGSTLVISAKIGTKSIPIADSTITDVKASNIFNYTPTAAGTYTFTVTLKNADGTVADTKTINSVKVLAAPSAKAVRVSKTSGVLLGDEVKLTAGATGGKTAYQYKFYVKKPGDTAPVAITDFSTASTFSYKMPAVGEYTFYVEIKDANNHLSNISESASVPIKVTNPPVISDLNVTKVTTGTETKVVYEKDPVALSAKLDDGKGVGALTCEFAYKQGTTETKIGDPVTIAETGTGRVATATTNFIPPTAGSYTLLVKVTDAQGTTVSKTLTSYKVLPLGSAKTVKLSKTTGLIVGDTIKLTASASGGKTPYSYAFYVTKPGGSEESIVTTDKKLANATYQLPAVGNYTFSVVVTDVNGVVLATKTQTVSQLIAVTNPPDLKPLTVTKDQTVGTHQMTPVAYENDALIIKAETTATTGVAPITYDFEAKLGNTVVDQQEQTNNGTFTFTKTKVGSYTFTVTATDSLGSKDTVKQASYKVLPEVTTKSIKASKTTGLIVGDTIKLTAAGSGGKTPYKYAFYVKKPGDTAPVALSDFSTANTFSYPMPAAGNYTFSVIVTDVNGVVCTNYDSVDMKITATVGNPPVIESLTADKANGTAVYPGDAVVLTAKVKAGTGLQNPTYAFYYLLGTNRIDIPVSSTAADSRTATATFTPSQGGTYNLCVDVFDGTDTVTQKISNYKVLPSVAVKSLKADKASGVNIGTTVKLTAVGTGGKGPYMYEFSWTNDKGLSKTTAYSTNATCNFIPSEAGFYTLQVNVKDATGKICSTAGVIQDFAVVDYPVVKTFTASMPSGQYVEKSIDLTAVVTGGLEPYTYSFAYQLDGGTQTTIEATDNKVNKVTFPLDKAGKYTFIVTVNDSNDSPVATKKIENYVVYAEPSIKSLTVSKDTITLGASVTVKATAEGGKNPLKYKFVFTNGETVVTRDYSTTSSYYFKPTVAGTYSVKVYVQDANNHTAELADKTITVNPKSTTP